MSLTKYEATKLAKHLATRVGKQWEPKVWDNMDWFYGVTLKGSIPGSSMEIHANHGHDSVNYVLYLHSSVFEVIVEGVDPTRLVAEALKQLKQKVDAANKAQAYLMMLTN